MLEKLEKEIELSEELLNGLPVNNSKNKRKFLKELDSEIRNYTDKLEEIKKEFDHRKKKYEVLEYNDISYDDITLNNLKKALTYTNTLSTAYEKLNLDKIVYQLSHYKEEDLIDNNKSILKMINIFKVAGISLTNKDFNYTKFVNDYMKMFFEDELKTDKIKTVFDDIYWQCPNIMMQIELNIRHLYISDKSKLEHYIKSVNKKITSHFKNGETSILEDYNYIRQKYSQDINKNNFILDFYNQKMDIDEYTDEKIKDIISQLFIDTSDSKIEIVKQMKNSLIEYKNYLKYKDLVDKIKELYNETLEKDFINKTIKKINVQERKLFKLNKKFNRRISKTSVNKLEPKINNIIDEIKKMYDEIDTSIFKIIVKTHIKENSTIFKSLLLIIQYYTVLADYFRDKNPQITYDELDMEINKLYDFIMDPNNTMINNITVLDEKELSDIIVTNYKMLNVNIDKSSIDDASLDELIHKLDKIIINYQLNAFNISIKELQDMKLIKLATEKK